LAICGNNSAVFYCKLSGRSHFYSAKLTYAADNSATWLRGEGHKINNIQPSETFDHYLGVLELFLSLPYKRFVCQWDAAALTSEHTLKR
jgi:hypothetical protein